MDFLGLSQDTWRFINSFSGWLSAFGTIFVATTALYLAYRSRRIIIGVRLGHKVAFQEGHRGPLPEYLSIEITNHGSRPVRVTHLEWHGGIIRGIEAAILLPQHPLSSSLPIELSDSQQARWMIPLGAQFVTSFAEIFLTSRLAWRIQLLAVRLCVFTSVGHIKKIPLTHSVRSGLIKHWRNVRLTGK